jgi:hypothetical protein
VLGLALDVGNGASIYVLSWGPQRSARPIEEVVYAEVGVPNPLELRLVALGLDQLGEAAEVGIVGGFDRRSRPSAVIGRLPRLRLRLRLRLVLLSSRQRATATANACVHVVDVVCDGEIIVAEIGAGPSRSGSGGSSLIRESSLVYLPG